RDAFTSHDDITAALQSSPWLIRAGRAEEKQKVDSRRARRAFVGTSKDGRHAIGFSTPATFSELAELLLSANAAEIIPFSEVLALDGATSAGFWSHIDGQQVSDPELVTVQNFVGVIPIEKAPRPLRANWPAIILGIITAISIALVA